ncbi:hypothetical protein BATDEDRAFT_89704 [Batrachochytrium dendrobatidis JAM81]|uniref:Uncharacterized protein n=2 Tax=Batrachochytrium dendrobatidis TaxID=109871 RepID=F4P6A8_BATDJ|nr:uncharacterized protein BATDEDRAFT_89704 [Batrachochytrium dendrobatidis JAM81]EGF79576.1 hypothetical protein BATDEDRAFT_89704 [Batrachochytrium dendrobatidis JAM81]KAJ8323022.1 hypothetical protein O5D80_008531 [Batrachochytrium dendrobatidis]KAK5665660.1 hypothetical protein QVD99_007308 [Batrachochytrium dendrobatidis]OAJ42593.1 hypothetical protein BDEG_26034 [Batrachochytrium dendrobatidis JEL423]|eukprot:XP_006680210.1 hypothetical protein BATDEDRAFT_89704 [Batrachochytrium dendrobatidis JAM81]
MNASSGLYDTDETDRVKRKQKIILLNQLSLQLSTVSSLQSKITAQRRALRNEEAYWRAQLQSIESSQFLTQLKQQDPSLYHVPVEPTPVSTCAPSTDTAQSHAELDTNAPFHFGDLDRQHFLEPIDRPADGNVDLAAGQTELEHTINTSNVPPSSTDLWAVAEDIGMIFDFDASDSPT